MTLPRSRCPIASFSKESIAWAKRTWGIAVRFTRQSAALRAFSPFAGQELCRGVAHARHRRAPIARRFPCGERRAEHNRAFRFVQQRESKRTASIIWAMASM